MILCAKAMTMVILIWVASIYWSWEPGNNEVPRLIFCVDTGEFFMIEVCFDSDAPKVEQSNCLYKGLPCKELLWVKGGYLVAIVEMGDAVVLKLKDGRLCCTNSILNMAPILDVAHEEEHGQMFACCGVAPEGSLRIIQSGISVEKQCRVGYIYEEVVGTWAVRMKVADSYHSFIVLSFVSETREFSVGLSFKDVTASVGFQLGCQRGFSERGPRKEPFSGIFLPRGAGMGRNIPPQPLRGEDRGSIPRPADSPIPVKIL